MAIVKLRPTSPGRRTVIKVTTPGLYKGDPYHPLVESKIRGSGRNNQGRVTVRHQGGGHKRKYRFIDFKRDKDGVVGKVERIEYDPNRSAHIALVLYADGERRYILATKNLVPGNDVISGVDAPIRSGNCLPLRNIPIGTTICCIEMRPNKGAQLARSAGAAVQLIAREAGYATLRLRSGEIRKVLENCRACVGEISNTEHNLRSFGKAGAKRWLGIRPTVRGVAMNPIDHPHGGGEGKTSGGRHPVSPTGKPTKGYRTRHNKRTNKMIIRDRRIK